MDISHAWKAHFKVSDQKITLLDALKKELINESQYLKWASQHYQIPVLDRSYFQSQEVSSELWDKFKNLKSWNSTLVPVGEWDGTLYVGCLEPSLTELQNKQSSIVFVLVSHESLESVWLRFNSDKPDSSSHENLKNGLLEDKTKLEDQKLFSLAQEQPTSQNEKKPESPESLSLMKESPMLKDDKESEPLSLTKEQPILKDDKESEPLSLTKEQPILKDDKESEPLSLTKEQPIVQNKKNSGNHQEPLSLTQEQPIPQIEKKQKTFMKEDITDDHFEVNHGAGSLVKGVLGKMVGLIVNDPSKKKAQTLKKKQSMKVTKSLSVKKKLDSSPDKVDFDFEKEDLAPVRPVKEEPVKSEPIQMSDIEDEGGLSIGKEKEDLETVKKESAQEEPVKINSMKTEDDSEDGSSEELSDNESSQTLASYVDSTGISHMSVLVKDKNKSDESDNSPSAVRLILENTKKYVDSYIMFTFSGSKFKPVKWSYNLTPQNKDPVSIKRPSFFRIAYVSKEYYHGHVPPILGNTEFFEAWGFTTLPHQILFIPFVEKDEILGGYLGMVSQKIDASPEEVSNIICKATLSLRKHYKMSA